MEREKKQAPGVDKKLSGLVESLRNMRSVLIAYSGGIDSSLLLRIAKDALGGNLLAVTAVSPIYPQEESNFACRMCVRLGVEHRIVKTNQLNNPAFIKNQLTRCYYCKRELFRRFWGIAKSAGINFVIDGSNVSDKDDFRPGAKAKRELNVRSPFEECGITKQDICRLSKILKVPVKTGVSTVCLASRIPYGQKILVKDLEMIGQAESYFRRLGIEQARVRYYKFPVGSGLFKQVKNRKRAYYTLARIEARREDIIRLAGSLRGGVLRYLKRLGYDYITLDLEGYRQGSLNPFHSVKNGY